MTMLDNSCWYTSAIQRPETTIQLVTGELTVHFLKPAKNIPLKAFGNLIKAGKKQDITEAQVYDDQGNTYAHGGKYSLIK